MLEIFNRKLRHLLFGQEGFALALTLIVWPVVMLMVTGVYVTGETIRRKIIMQTAADTAALAGAAAEADTLSRMAVVNRMLAWTYIQANKMEMDYVVDDWLGRVVASMNSHGVDRATLNNSWNNVTKSDIQTARSGYAGTASRLDDAYANITAMNQALTELAEDSRERSREAAETILAANSPDLADALSSVIDCCDLPLVLDVVSSERDFLDMTPGGYHELSSCRGFGDWWVQRESAGSGFRRMYQTHGDCLVAKVDYQVNEGTVLEPLMVTHTETIYGRNAYANSVVARPRVLGGSYVRNGTVVVSLKYPLRNPLEAVFGALTGSMYDSYTVEGTDMWCAGAARACPWNADRGGYSLSDGEKVCSTDWDAVLISLAKASDNGKAGSLLRSSFERLSVSGWGDSAAIDWESLDGKAVH